MYNIYLWLILLIKDRFFVYGMLFLENRRIEMYYVNIDEESKSRILIEFLKFLGNV